MKVKTTKEYQREYRRKHKVKLAEYMRNYQKYGEKGVRNQGARIARQFPVEPPTGREWWFKDGNLQTVPGKSLHAPMPPEKFAAECNRMLEGMYG